MGNQTIIIGFQPQDSSSRSRPHITHASGSLTPLAWSSSNYPHHSVVANGGSGSCTLHLSNGSSVTLPASVAPITLSNWTLTIESWTAPADLYDVEGTVKTSTTYTLSSLVPWSRIPSYNLTNVSGRGYYSTTFSWPPSPSSSSPTPSGATIDFGPVVHTLRVFVNGVQLPPLDVTAAKADLSGYLRRGENTVEAVVATPLGNVLRPIWRDIRTYGANLYDSALGQAISQLAGLDLAPPVAEYGLVRDVVVEPYYAVEI